MKDALKALDTAIELLPPTPHSASEIDVLIPDGIKSQEAEKLMRSRREWSDDMGEAKIEDKVRKT